MIPTFPEFKDIEWTDRNEVEQLTNNFPPYSDFNFVSMWSWNIREEMKLSRLNDNLVVLFYDYNTQAPFLSFLGVNDLSETANKLLDYSYQNYNGKVLQLVPEDMALQLSSNTFNLIEDEDSFDYILSVPYLTAFDKLPRSSNKAAYFCQKFISSYPNHSVKDGVITDLLRSDCVDMFKKWAAMTKIDHWELNEYRAFDRFIRNEDCSNRMLTVYNDGSLVAFASYEILGGSYSVIHFAKADKEFSGVYYALLHFVAKVLAESEIEYLNIEQDMGLPGLRQSKRKYKPEFYLKKYKVQHKELANCDMPLNA